MIWYYENNGQIAGPVSEAELMDGRIGGGTLVWTNGMPGWQPASNLWPQRWPVPAFPAAPAVIPHQPAVQVPAVENFYAPPKPVESNKEEDFALDGLYQFDGDLVCPVTAHLPHCCVKCASQAAPVRMDLKLDWVKPNSAGNLTSLLLFGPLGLLIFTLKNRQKATINVSLCHEHNRAWVRRSRMVTTAIWGGLGLGVMAWFVRNFGVTFRASCILGSVAGILFGVIMGLLNKTPLVPAEIGKHMGRFKGAAPQLVATLPRWTHPID